MEKIGRNISVFSVIISVCKIYMFIKDVGVI